MKKSISLIVVLCFLASVSSYAQIVIASNEPASTASSTTPNYSLKFEKPNLNEFPEGALLNKLFNTLYFDLRGEKILLLIEESNSVFINNTTGEVNLDTIVPRMKYYTIGEYLVCREQVDSLAKVLYSYGVKTKETVELPERPTQKFSGITTSATRKKIEEYEKQKKEYDALPWHLPNVVRPDLYLTLSEWNKKPDNHVALQLIDEDGNSYYVNEGIKDFIPVSIWNNFIGCLINSELYVSDQLLLAREWNPTYTGNFSKVEKSYKDFASITPQYTCQKVEVSNDDFPDVYISIVDKTGALTKGRLVIYNYEIYTENGHRKLPYYEIRSNGNRYIMLPSTMYDFYKNKMEVLISQYVDNLAKENALYAEQQKEEQKRKQEYIKELKSKYGDYFGQQIGEGNVVVGMTKEMCIKAWGLPTSHHTEITEDCQYEFLHFNYGSFMNNAIMLKDGKVVEVSVGSMF